MGLTYYNILVKWRIPSAIKEESKPQKRLAYYEALRMFVNMESVFSIYESLYPIQGTRYIFFDGIQYTDNWKLWMKVIYDSRKDKGND